jgi:2-oxoglutarate ferredoxin oxidoreductase subunit delta
MTKGLITISQERCKGCSLCMEFCPKKAIYLSDKLNLKGYFVAAFAEDQECTGCGTCAVMCPDVAIEVFKQ